jgi:transposase-like protein
MARPSRYSPEVQERAIRMVREHGSEHPSQWAAIASIASKLGCTTTYRAHRRCRIHGVALAGIHVSTTRLTGRPPSARMTFFDQCRMK